MNTSTYDTDFYLWTQQQADLLRRGQLQAIDLENVAEELESMGKSDRRAIESYLANILTHLLKWRYQPARRGNSWRMTIRNGRKDIQRILKDSPSLKPRLPELIDSEYPGAREDAAAETRFPLSTFPEQCPFTVDEITGDWWPD